MVHPGISTVVRTVAGMAALAVLFGGPVTGAQSANARDLAPRDSTVASLDLAPLSPHDIVIDATGTYAYAVTCTRGPTAEILRLNLSTFTVDDSATLSTDCARAVVIQDDSIYVTTSDRLYRLDASTFGPSGPSTSDSVAIDNFGNALDVYGSYAYIGHHAGGSGNQITKVNISGSSMAVTSTFPSGGDYPMSLEINPSGTFAYVTHTISHSLAKIRLSDDSVVGSLQVGMQPYGLALDDSGTYAYVPSAGRESFSTLTTPPWLVRVRLSDFTFDDSVTLPFYWAFGVDVDSSGTTAYVGQDREGANVAKVNLGPGMSIAETITVPTAPTSLAISPTAPFVYTANSADLYGTTVSKVAIVGSTPAPTVSGLSVTSGPLAGGGALTISGDNLTGATGVSFGGTAATILSGSDDTIAVTVPAAGSAGDRNVTVTTPGGTSTQSVTYTYLANPLATAPTAPQPPSAVPGNASALVAWSPVSATGSFPVSTYQVASSPSGGSCLTTGLSCEITGLTNGTAYTFSVRALSGAGWGPWSAASAAVTPTAAARASIVISGSRDLKSGATVVTVTGRSNLAPGTTLRPWIKLGRQLSFRQGLVTLVTNDSGAFEWSRRTARSVTLYVRTLDGSVTSNRVTIR